MAERPWPHRTMQIGRTWQLELRSSTVGYGPEPLPDELVEQRLMICGDGAVSLRALTWAELCREDEEEEKEDSGAEEGSARGVEKSAPRAEKSIPRGWLLRRRVTPTVAGYLLDLVRFFAEFTPELPVVTDIGHWVLMLSDREGQRGEFTGYPCPTERVPGSIAPGTAELSQSLREHLAFPTLLGMDRRGELVLPGELDAAWERVEPE